MVVQPLDIVIRCRHSPFFGPHSQLSWDPLAGHAYLDMVTEILQVLLSVSYLAKFQ